MVSFKDMGYVPTESTFLVKHYDWKKYGGMEE
jgi:hypothetical protein